MEDGTLINAISTMSQATLNMANPESILPLEYGNLVRDTLFQLKLCV